MQQPPSVAPTLVSLRVSRNNERVTLEELLENPTSASLYLVEKVWVVVSVELENSMVM
jgi:hypothetical protein